QSAPMLDSPEAPPSVYPPREDEPPTSRRVAVALPDVPPTVTRVLLAAVGVGFLVEMVVGTQLALRAGAKLYEAVTAVMIGSADSAAWGAQVNDAILLHGQFYRLFTLMFLHYGIIHLAVNAYGLWIIGTDVERFFGHLRFTLVFFLGGLTASVASL